MKKIIALALMMALCGTTVTFAHHYTLPPTPAKENVSKIYSLSELTNEVILDFFNGKTSEIILELTEGSTLPFKIFLNSEFLALEFENNNACTIKILKTCFIKCIGDSFLFSTDLTEWKEFQEFFSGMISASLIVNENTPEFDLNIDLNKKT